MIKTFTILFSTLIISGGLLADTIFDTTQQQIQETIKQTGETTATTEADFVKKCVNMVSSTVECNTKKNTISKESCTTLKCDASNSMVESAEAECEATECEPIHAQVVAAQAEKVPWDGCSFIPIYGAFCKAKAEAIQARITELYNREQTCRAECQACKAADLNESDDYNNKFVCGTNYGCGYDTAISSAKAEAAKLETECRSFCKGKSKLNWTNIIGLVSLASSLSQVGKATQGTGTDKSGSGTNTCSLMTDEKARVKCYCEQDPKYEYIDGNCIPKETTTPYVYTPAPDGGGGVGAGDIDAGKIAAGSGTTESGTNKDMDKPAGAASGGSSGSVGSGVGGGAAGSTAENKNNKKDNNKDSDKNKISEDSGSNTQGIIAQDINDAASTVGEAGGYSSKEGGEKTGKPLDKNQNIFDEINKILVQKYRDGSITGGGKI